MFLLVCLLIFKHLSSQNPQIYNNVNAFMEDDITDNITSTHVFHLQNQQMLRFCSLKIQNIILILLMSSVLEQITPQVSSLKPQTFIVSHSLLGSGIWELLSWVDLAWGLARGCSQAVGQVFGLPKASLGWEVGVPCSHEWLWAESSSSSPRGPLPRAARASAAGSFESKRSKRAHSRWELGCLYRLGKDIPLLLRVLRVTQKVVNVRR